MALLATALAAQQDPAPVLLIAKILLPGVHGRIDHLAADYYHARLFVAAAGNDSLEVIDVRTNRPLASIHQVAEPRSVAYVKATNRIFVTNGIDGSLRIFDGTTLKPLDTVHLGMDPGAIRVDTAQQRVYVGYGDGAIAVLDAAGKRLTAIALHSRPESFQIALRQRRLFANLPESHSIAVIDTERYQVIAQWPIQNGRENFPLALDEEKRRIFVACRRPARLLVLDMDSGREVARLSTVGDANDLSYDAIHARIYVIGGEGQFAVYAQQTADRYKQIDSVATVAGARTGLFVPEWNLLFVAIRDFAAHAAEIRIYRPQ